MAFFGTSTSTSYDAYNTTSTHYEVKWEEPVSITKEAADMRWNFHSPTIEEVVKSRIMERNVAIYAYRRSDVYRDRTGFEYSNIRTYYDDPIQKGYDAPVSLGSYDFSLIIDALEYMPSMMSRANLIKEAMAALKPSPNYRESGVIIFSKTPEMVSKLAKTEGYEESEDGLLIKKRANNFFGLTLRGLSVDDLIKTAYFAGASYIEEIKSLETDRACIGVYLNKQD